MVDGSLAVLQSCSLSSCQSVSCVGQSVSRSGRLVAVCGERHGSTHQQTSLWRLELSVPPANNEGEEHLLAPRY